MKHTWKRLSEYAPGIALASSVALLAWLAEARIGGAVMLYALLFGMFLNPVASRGNLTSGIAFSARHVLRMGVALLGAKLTLVDAAALGAPTAILVVSGVLLTLIGGSLLGRACGLSKDFSVLTAGAVAICGASAALAIAAVLPAHKHSEQHTILAIAGVTTLSTIAMILYPLLAVALGMSDQTAGIFLGASIHDVAQVVGAADTISAQARDTATLVKLMRVACLVPVVAVLSWLVSRRGADSGSVPGLPAFLIAFVVLMLLNTFGLIPAGIQTVLAQAARIALVIAVAALGIKTSLKSILGVGPRPVAALILQTLLLGLFVLAFVLLLSTP